MAKVPRKAALTPVSAVYQKARRYLARRDPVLKRLTGAIGPCTLWQNPNRFAALVRSIISQQISGKAAIAISSRLEQALGSTGITPEGILAMSGEEFARSVSLLPRPGPCVISQKKCTTKRCRSIASMSCRTKK